MFSEEKHIHFPWVLVSLDESHITAKQPTAYYKHLTGTVECMLVLGQKLFIVYQKIFGNL